MQFFDFMNVLNTIFLIFVVVMVFNLVIFVHELGHFLAAKWRGLQVDRFQIWFGKPIWSKTINGVQYGLGSIPFGGFVALPEMAPMEAIEGKNTVGASSNKTVTPLDKIIVAVAGPIFSLLLAFCAAIVVWKTGKLDVTIPTTQIGFVMPGSPAEKAGLMARDTILEIEGERVESFDGNLQSVTQMVALSEGKTVELKIQREGVADPFMVSSEFEIPETQWFQRTAMRRIGIAPYSDLVVAGFMENGPGASAGLEKGDQLVAINGVAAKSIQTVHHLTKTGDLPLELEILRDGETLRKSLTPRVPDVPEGHQPMLGVKFANSGLVERQLSHPSPIAQIVESAEFMWVSLKKVVSPKTNLTVQHFSGPIGIGKMMYSSLAVDEGWRHLLWLMVLFNVNLAIFNMLPFPVLDGGHTVMAIIEWVRGKPIQVKILEFVQLGFVAIIFSLFLFITSKDIGDNLNFKKEKQQDPMFLPVDSSTQ